MPTCQVIFKCRIQELASPVRTCSTMFACFPKNLRFMDHILNDETGGIDFDRYLRYLNSIQDRLPIHVYSFASDSRNFDFHSRSSLHDAWLDTITINETASGDRNDVRRIAINICLLGPYHDRKIHLHYTGVERYQFDTPTRHGDPRFNHTGHGDLFTHEVRLGERSLLIHELEFERGTTVLIECADFRHSEEITAVKPGNGGS